MDKLPLLPLTVLDEYPAVDTALVDRNLKIALTGLNRKIVVLDDDPTGVQTVHDVSVYTQWDEASLRAGFAEANSIFFILTNSRGFSREETIRVHVEIAERLVKISAETGIDYILVSRSDSTMRGHFPLETETLRQTIEQNSEKKFDGEIICPFFQEGGRYTIENVHYVREGDMLTPAGQTEFARDKTFGYHSSNIGDYVAEKTGGRYQKENCVFISIDDLRSFKLDKIDAQLQTVNGFNKVILNAIDYVDVKLFMIAFCRAVASGKEFIFRSGAAITKVLGGISDQPLLAKSQLIHSENTNGGIVVIGSHVNKTTAQFEALRTSKLPLEFIEFDQHLVKIEGGLEGEVDRVVALTEKTIRSGRTAVVYTRRERFDLETDDKELQLQVSTRISDAVTSVVGRLTMRPNFIIAKGGITSSDVGTKALKVRKATVMGQIKPGIPVWMTGEESLFPGMPYIIFPGNVGEVETLKEIVEMLS